MAKDLVFLVHGMGVNVDGDGKAANEWHKAAVEALKAAAERPETLDLLRIESGYLLDRVDFKFINYDSIFNDLVGNWETRGAQLTKFPGFEAVGGLFQNAGEIDDNFFWTHASDVLLYRTPVVRGAVVHHVLEEIKRGLGDFNSPTWSVIAHSLGTSVATDALNHYEKVDRGRATWATPPRTVAMVANVSAALQTSSFPSYRSNLLPGKNFNYYITADHVLDPFTWIRRFRPDTPEWTEARKHEAFIEAIGLNDLGFLQSDDSARFLTNPGQAILESHPHGFANYIANPRVHLPILSKILRRGIKQEQITSAAEAYEADVVNSLKSDIKTKAEAFIAGVKDDASQNELIAPASLKDLYRRLKTLYELWSKT